MTRSSKDHKTRKLGQSWMCVYAHQAIEIFGINQKLIRQRVASVGGFDTRGHFLFSMYKYEQYGTWQLISPILLLLSFFFFFLFSLSFFVRLYMYIQSQTDVLCYHWPFSIMIDILLTPCVPFRNIRSVYVNRGERGVSPIGQWCVTKEEGRPVIM